MPSIKSKAGIIITSPRKFFQQLRTGGAGAFRVKLHAVKVIFLHGGGERLAVIALGDGVGIHGHGVAVDEIEVRAVFNTTGTACCPPSDKRGSSPCAAAAGRGRSFSARLLQ